MIITVDWYSSDWDKIREAKDMEIDVSVTDHHGILIDGKNEFHLINPKRNVSLYPFRDIAGVTVAFKLCCFIVKELLSLNNKELGSIMQDWYHLIFLGTYADKVPLKDENWVLSRLGFKSLQKTERKGIRILSEMLCKGNNCDEGMIQKMISVLATAKTKAWGEKVGFRVLTENNEDYLRRTISQLVRQSEEWYSLANQNYRRIFASINENMKERIIFVYESKTPFDYVGFCASRLKERFNKPGVITTNKDK